MIRVPSRRDRTSPARASTCRCCEVLATLCEISPASSSTDRSPWASTSTISARRPLPSACATDAIASNSAAFAAPFATIVKLSLEYLQFKLAEFPHKGSYRALLLPRPRGDHRPSDASEHRRRVVVLPGWTTAMEPSWSPVVAAARKSPRRENREIKENRCRGLRPLAERSA